MCSSSGLVGPTKCVYMRPYIVGVWSNCVPSPIFVCTDMHLTCPFSVLSGCLYTLCTNWHVVRIFRVLMSLLCVMIYIWPVSDVYI